MTVCQTCAGTVIEYDHAAGNGFCVACGTVVEENLIVNEIEFGETSNGAAMVQGSYVAQGATHARMSGPYGNRGNNESREQTIANANKKIQSIANALRLSEMVQLAATRLYTLAVEHKFTKGRKSLNVVAVCLYVACRQKETKTYMLIDFSDLLTVNVFELGHTYLQLVQTLNLRLPLVDPSHYISRFAALLEFGDETAKVATDAVRLVQRFDRDWMTRGRRPAGICGAALLLAARMNNFRRSVEEIVQVVKIADTTLKKRLDEFKATPSGSLTLADFRNVWLEDEMDPPAYTKGREREEREREEREAAELGENDEDGVEEADGGGKGKGKAKAKSKKGKGKATKKGKLVKGKGKEKDPDLAGESGRRKRKRGEDSDEDADADGEDDDEVVQRRRGFDASLLEQGILAGVAGAGGSGEDVEMRNIDPVLLAQSQAHTGDGRIAGSSSLPLANGSMPPSLGTFVNGSLPPAIGSSSSFSMMPPSSSGTLVDGPSSTFQPPIPSSSSFQDPKASHQPSSALPQSLGPSSSLQESIEASLSTAIAQEVEGYLHDAQAETLGRALDQEEERRRAEREERWRRGEEARRRMERELEMGTGIGGGAGMEMDAESGTSGAGREEVGMGPAPPPTVGQGEGPPQPERDGAAQPAATGNAGDEEIDELTGLDESELDKFLLSPAEVKIKERVWVELNRDYLEALAAKGEQAETGAQAKSRKRRKTNNKPRDASSAAGTSAAESVRNLIKKNPKYSKRINYDALKDLFVDQPQSGILNPGIQVDDKDEEDGAGLYTLDDDKADDDVGVGADGGLAGEGMVIIEGEASVVQLPERPGAKKTGADVGMAHGHEEEDDDEDEKDDEDGDGDVQMDGGWEEAWEQEV